MRGRIGILHQKESRKSTEDDPTTFGLVDVVAHDIFEQEENPLFKIVADENDNEVLEIVVGGAVIYLWPKQKVLEKLQGLDKPEE